MRMPECTARVYRRWLEFKGGRCALGGFFWSVVVCMRPLVLQLLPRRRIQLCFAIEHLVVGERALTGGSGSAETSCVAQPLSKAPMRLLLDRAKHFLKLSDRTCPRRRGVGRLFESRCQSCALNPFKRRCVAPIAAGGACATTAHSTAKAATAAKGSRASAEAIFGTNTRLAGSRMLIFLTPLCNSGWLTRSLI